MIFHQHKRLEEKQTSLGHQSEGSNVTYYNYGGSIKVFLESPRPKKRKGGDTADHFSSALTLATTERWMNWLKGAICNKDNRIYNEPDYLLWY